MTNKEAFLELKSKLDAWLSFGSENSLTNLARNSGVPYSTIKRIYKGDSSPALENLLAILTEIVPRDQMAAYLKSFYPDSYKLLGGGALVSGTQKTADSMLRDYYRDEDALVIIELADMYNGVSREQVQDLLGRSGINMLEVLHGNDLLKEDEEGKFRFNGPEGTVDLRIGLNKVRAFAGSFLRTNKAMVAIRSQSLKKSAVKQIVEILNDAQGKVDQVMRDTQNHGEFPMSAIMTVGLHDTPIPYD